MSTIDPQQFGELKAIVVQVERAVQSLNADMRALNTALKDLTDQLSQARGGWKVLLIVASVGATLASFVNWLLSHISMRP